MADDDRPTLTAEDLDRIRARLIARANLGVDPQSPAFMDAGPGSIYGDLEGPGALELDEAYDFADTAVKATNPLTSYGEWLDDWAEALGLVRRDEAPAGGVVTFTGTPGTDIPAGGFEVTTTAVGDEDPTAYEVLVGGEIPGGGSLDLEVRAVLAGSSGNVPAGTVTVPSVEVAGLASLTNALPMTGGADVESDEVLNGRVRQALTGDVGSGTQADYRRWLLGRPGVGFVTVRPLARGDGTVDVYITDMDNNPMPPARVAEEQAWLDPDPAMGLGQAPIGHDALVLTPGSFAVAIAADVEHETGYSLDGVAGTRATRAAIAASVRRYVDSLDVGEDVIRDQVIRAIVSVRGVVKITTGTLTLNGAGAGDLAVPADQVAASSTIDLGP